MTVSALILTLNEEINIGECLDSLSWCDDVVVLDSLSTDSTCAIVRDKGGRVVTRAFDNWSAHQNWAVQNIAFRIHGSFILTQTSVVRPTCVTKL